MTENTRHLLDEDAEARRLAQTFFERPLVLEAGAGTGKTSALVARVVAWCLGPGWRRRGEAGPAAVLGGVVAITFTDAAAAEMAERVGRALRELAAGSSPSGVDLSLLPATPLREARAAALVSALDQLQVRTIHAFCRKILSTWPLSASLHPAFTVDADGALTDNIAEEVVRTAMAQAYGDPGEPAWLTLADAGYGPDTIMDAVRSLAARPDAASTLAEAALSPERVAAFRGELVSAVAALQRACRGLRGVKNVGARVLRTLDWLDRLEAELNLQESWSAAGLLGLPAAAEEQLSPAEDTIGEWSKSKLGKRMSEALPDAGAALVAAASELKPRLRQLGKSDPTLLPAAQAVLAPLLAEVERRKRSKGVLSFDALLVEASRLCSTSATVRAALRSELDLLLVDEFQDTDRLQCELVRALALGPTPGPSLFLVGDPKQSIYGFRRADLRAYDLFVQEVLAEGGRLCRLSLNFRSVPPVLDEVERLMAPDMRAELGVMPGFQPLVPSEANRRKELDFLPVEHWTLPGRDDALEARALARDLVQLHRQGVAWRDVGVLFRSLTHVETWLEALRSAEIPYVVSRDRSYYQRREVIEASALLHSILDPSDDLALLTLLRSPAVGVPDAALVPLWQLGVPDALARAGADPFSLNLLSRRVEAAAAAVPHDVPGLDRLGDWLPSCLWALMGVARLRAAFAGLPADEFVRELRHHFQMEATASTRFQAPWRLANLDRFFELLVLALEENAGDSQAVVRALRRAVREAEEAEEGRPSEVGDDAVRVMSIHKSKGLQFAHVYVVQMHKEDQVQDRALHEVEDGEFKVFGCPSLGWWRVERRRQSVQAAERLRLFYVAMTRAELRVVTTGVPADSGKSWPEARSFSQLMGGRSDVEGLRAAAVTAGEPTLHAEGALWRFLELEEGEPEERRFSPKVDHFGGSVNFRNITARYARFRAEAATRMAIGLVESPSAAHHAASKSSPRERNEARARAVGTAVHAAIEAWDLNGEAELGRGALRMARRLSVLVAPALLQESLAEAMVLLEQFSSLLLPRLHAVEVLGREVPLLLSDGPGFVSGTIDLLIRDERGLVVVDFKTDGVRSEAEAERRAAGYRAQGARYVEAVHKATGEDVRFELWFVQGGWVVEG